MVQITNTNTSTRRPQYPSSFLHSCRSRSLMRGCVITMMMMVMVLATSVAVLSWRQFLTSASTRIPALVLRDGNGYESVELKTKTHDTDTDTSINRNADADYDADVVVSPKNLNVRTSNLGSASVDDDDWCDVDVSVSSQAETAAETETRHHRHRHRKLWQAIDNTTAKYLSKNTKVSGGLFLYPRQANLFAKVMEDLISLHHQKQKHNHDHKHDQNRPFQVCETGFGSGHSTAFFLSQSEDAQIVTFDKFDRPYQIPVVELLQQEFPDRIQHVAGNSCETLPQFFKESESDIESNQQQHQQKLKHRTRISLPSFQRCDLLHGSSLCKSDNIDLVQHAPCGTILTSTAMHSITDKDVYFGPNAQWRKLRDDQCISDIVCFQEEEKRLDQSFIFAKKGESMAHKFCLAVVTGFCSRPPHRRQPGDLYECEKQKMAAAKDILNKLCKTLQIEVPA